MQADRVLLSEEDLARVIRTARSEAGLTQTDVAERLVEAGRYDRLTKQAVSKAENFRSSDGMGALRVAIYEMLTGSGLCGPVWYRPEEE